MKVFDKLILVSKASIDEKRFLSETELAKLSKADLKKITPFLPSEEEKDFYEVYSSKMPQLARLQRKMSVCLDVEVTELEEEKLVFIYGPSTYTLIDPGNAFQICRALEKSSLDALAEMASQGCVLRDGEPLTNIKNGHVKIDELKLLEKVASKFFFQTFLV